jgi:C2 domain in Dock180 and Zizimin proteins
LTVLFYIYNNQFQVKLLSTNLHPHHIKFTFMHRTTDETKAKTEKPFGMAFLRLWNSNGTVLKVIGLFQTKNFSTEFNQLIAG